MTEIQPIPDLFNQPEPSGEELRDKGIEKALESAESAHNSWADKAYAFLETYMKTNRKFMIEEVRTAAEGKVPNPPSNRAWGGIAVRARCAGLIRSIGRKCVTNPNAHKAFATEWLVID